MPAVLGRMLMPTIRRFELHIIRFASVTGEFVPPKSTYKKWTPSEVGYFHYERDRSRDSKQPNPQKRGDTPRR